VEQILINLLANASLSLESITDAPHSATDSGAERIHPTIRITTTQRGEQVVLTVSDNGPGIAPEHLSRVFDPFFTTRPEGQGTGLGLAVVHGIVSSYGGTLEVASEPWRETVFTVTLPAVQDAVMSHTDNEEGRGTPDSAGVIANSIRVADAPELATAPRPLEILVVEDEGAIRRVLQRFFEARGHTVTLVDNGADALRMAQQSWFDVVICDMRLPGIDGVEVLLQLRKMPTGVRSRCILVSGSNSPPPAGAVLAQLNLAAIVNKPFEVDALCRIVEA